MAGKPLENNLTSTTSSSLSMYTAKQGTTATGGAFGRLQSSLTNFRDGMEQQNEVLHGLQDQLHLKSEELDNLSNLQNPGKVKPSNEKYTDDKEKSHTSRENVITKTLETGQIEGMLNKTETIESGPASSTLIMVQSDEVRSMSTPANTGNRKGTLGVDVDRNNAVFSIDLPDDVTDKNEVEELKLKLKTATQICAQQEAHFSNLVRELEQRLYEAIAGRDELLTLRQRESGNQQKLIKQLQAALLQAKQNLELKNQELSDNQGRMKADHEKLTQALTLLTKLHNVLKNEEDKRGRTNTFTTVSAIEQLSCGDMLLQVLSNCLLEDDNRINDVIRKCHEVERQLMEMKESCEEEKMKLTKDYERKSTQVESDHSKALDIAANRTLAERGRIAELLREIDENRKSYEKITNDEKGIIARLEEENKALVLQLEEKSKAHEIQHIKDATVAEEQQKRIEELQREKEEMFKHTMTKASSQTVAVEKIAWLEKRLNEADQQSKTFEANYLKNEKLHLETVSQLKQELRDKSNEVQELISEHEEQLKQKVAELLKLEKNEAVNQKYILLENKHNETVQQLACSKEEMTRKTEECAKCFEECRTLTKKHENLLQEKNAILSEKDDLLIQAKNLNEKISQLQEEKSSLSSMIRDNVQDLNRAKDMIDTLQIKLDEREKKLDDFNKQDAELAELLLKKHLVGESLLDERQQIVEVLEEKIRDVDELKEIRDALAYKLESKIQILSELEANCRSLEAKLDVRNNELEVIMEDRNKVVKELKTREEELSKIKEERDSLVTLMNGKQSEKEREINKLITRLKGSQHDLALTKKVLEAKREANGKAVKMATMTQEEITAKRKEIDALKDRIKWLQESLQATTEEKAYFENKTSELASEIENTNIENKSLKMELDNFVKNYDEASARLRHMEKALEKAGLKFAESQALVEKLEQDLAKIKLQHSLEVKDLQRKTKTVPEKEPSVQVVPLNLQKISTALVRENMLRTTKELNATQQRLIDEAEMTKGFKVLLNDLHQVLSDIKNSGGMTKKINAVVEKSTSTVDTIEQPRPGSDSAKRSTKQATKSITNKTQRYTLNKAQTHQSSQRNQKPQDGDRKSPKVKPPLLSSSPKRLTSDVNDAENDDPALDYSVSDISDVMSEYSESQHFGMDKGYNNMQNNGQSKDVEYKSRDRIINSRYSTNSSTDKRELTDDVESLIMTKPVEEGSHRRAQKILDLLTLKGQELTMGNQKIAELIGRQHDGIQRCREAEQNIKKILK